MKRTIIASVLAAVLVFPAGVLAHGDKHQGKQEDGADVGHEGALGRPGDPGKVIRNVEVEMNDAMRFNPESIRVKRGETIRLIVKNTGKLKHEMVLGTIEELKAHAELMRKFTNAGTFDFACLEPGHYEAGMVGKVQVESIAESNAKSGQAMTEGLVKKIDRNVGKITISHGPIGNLGMPKMTMIFRVKDPAMFDRLKEGDRIRFLADKVNGVFTVMEFEPAE